MVYVKRISVSQGLWKIVLVTDEKVMTRDSEYVHEIINFLDK